MEVWTWVHQNIIRLESGCSNRYAMTPFSTLLFLPHQKLLYKYKSHFYVSINTFRHLKTSCLYWKTFANSLTIKFDRSILRCAKSLSTLFLLILNKYPMSAHKIPIILTNLTEITTFFQKYQIILIKQTDKVFSLPKKLVLTNLLSFNVGWYFQMNWNLFSFFSAFSEVGGYEALVEKFFKATAENR